MFYDHKSYQVISEKIVEVEPESAKKHPELLEMETEFWDIECKNLKTYDHCPFCKVGSVAKKESSHKTVYDYNERKDRIERVGITSQRYICTTCKKTFIAETTVDGITYTKDYEKRIALLLIDKQYSSTLLSLKYERSHKFISGIVHNYTSKMLLGFMPPENSNVLCLYPFIYQRKQRYYLAHLKEDGMWEVICFFGYIDAIQEIKNYFSFPRNRSLLSSKEVILVDFDEELVDMLIDILDNPNLAFVRTLMKDKLLPLAADISADKEGAKANKIHSLIDHLFDEKGHKEELRKWKSEIKKDEFLSSCLGGLLKAVIKYEEFCLRSHKYKENLGKLNDLKKGLNSCSRMNLSFDIMTARILHEIYGNYATTDFVEMFMTPDNYDEASGTYYRQPLEKIPVAKNEDKQGYDNDEATSQLEGIHSLIKEERKEKLYYTFEDGDEPPFGPL